MELQRALAQVAEIQEQAARADVYRGYRSAPVAASGLIGLAAAWLQPSRLDADPIAFVLYWTVVAALAGFVGVSEIVYNYVVHDEALARRRTRRVVGQMMPGLLAGAIMAACFARLSTEHVPLLPGIWAICFGVGIFASLPYLVRSSGWIALYFYAAGVLLLWNARGPETLTPWAVGGTFGVGQLLAAAVLYWSLESRRSAPADRDDSEDSEDEEEED
jgi:hypothetical protein